MNTRVIKLNEEPSNKRRNGATEDKRTKNTIESQIQLNMVYSPSGSNIVLDKTHRNVDHTIIFMTQGSMDMEVSLIKFHLVRNSLLMIPANSVTAINNFSPDCQCRLLSFPTFEVGQNDLIGYEPLMIDVEEPYATTTDNYFQMMQMPTSTRSMRLPCNPKGCSAFPTRRKSRANSCTCSTKTPTPSAPSPTTPTAST